MKFRLRARDGGHARSDPAISGRIGANLVSAASQMLVFDMDGVLVDVTESYRETVVSRWNISPVKPFRAILIQDYKNQGGWNNDWLLSQKICRGFGRRGPYATIVEYFNYLVSRSGHDSSRALAAARRPAGSAGLRNSSSPFSPGRTTAGS
jgi:hypothetical protein